eukprot:COSAG02_NODE_1040_length_15035_cov_198.613819_6_plen_94_part_00
MLEPCNYAFHNASIIRWGRISSAGGNKCMDDLERMGIKHAPMPVGLIYDTKRHPDNSWDKDKLLWWEKNASELFRVDSRGLGLAIIPGKTVNY